MNTGRKPLGTTLLGLVVALVVAASPGVGAFAQEGGDAYLDRFDLAIGNLERAVAAMPDDPVRAREEVDLAFNALMTLSRDAASGPLAGALERVFERARTAISNASRQDLAVQTAVLEGGFQRLVYDAALRAAAEGNLASARARMVHLADSLGVPEADGAALRDVERPASSLRFDLEAGVAAVLAQRLDAARAAGDQGAAYHHLARAYGAFLLVQDSPRTAAGLNQAFVDAATALVDERADELATSLDAIAADVRALAEAARERRATVATAATDTVQAEPMELPALEAAPAPEGTVAEATVEAAAEAVAEPALDGGSEATDAPALPLDVDLAVLRRQFEEEALRARLEVLEADLAAAGVPAAARPAQAEALEAAGYTRFGMAVDAFGAEIAAALAALHRGDAASAAAALERARSTYGAFVSPALRPGATSIDLATLDLLAHLQGVVGLRVQDLVVASGQVEAVRQALGGTAPSPLQDGARQTTAIWAGTLRSAVLLVIGLLALVPLFLLNLAFGGGNRNWQLIGVALFLLLLPALAEGVIALGTLLADLAGIEALSVMGAFSVFGSTVAQTVWAATTLLALLFAIGGLYGICLQFGLVGRRPKPARAATATRSTRTATETIDWDDDV